MGVDVGTMASGKPSILFVDDEVQVLRALQNMMRRDRERWNMEFALGADKALVEIRQKSFDVIVSDMKMPGVDGVALLTAVKQESPATVRIMLSGETDRVQIMRALPLLHQFISKPCDVQTLRGVLNGSVEAVSHADEAAVRAAIGELDKLPSPPRLYFELTQLASSPNASMARVSALIAEDPAMTAKVLQLANSAFFGLSEHTSSIATAVGYLGIELVKYLALTSSVFAAAERDPFAGFSTEHIQESSLRAATLARKIADRGRADHAFVAGLLHDLGQVILAVASRERYAAVAEVVRITGEPLVTVERDFLGVTHAEVGAYLLGIWGLPREIVLAVAHHHTPGKAPAEVADIATAVHVADALADASCMGESIQNDRLDREHLARAGLLDRLPSWRGLIDR